tara:strand:+ start:2318 stop:2440 length:123 start_codon:yes stop_codon:yes gene_type:complete
LVALVILTTSPPNPLSSVEARGLIRKYSLFPLLLLAGEGG